MWVPRFVDRFIKLLDKKYPFHIRATAAKILNEFKSLCQPAARYPENHYNKGSLVGPHVDRRLMKARNLLHGDDTFDWLERYDMKERLQVANSIFLEMGKPYRLAKTDDHWIAIKSTSPEARNSAFLNKTVFRNSLDEDEKTKTMLPIVTPSSIKRNIFPYSL